MKEWKDVIGFEGMYVVSNAGDVKGLNREIIQRNGHPYSVKEKILKGSVSQSTGYRMVSISGNGSKRLRSVHRLVAESFIENPLNKPEVNHIDGNKLNNNVENLEWCTSAENQAHSYELGLQIAVFGEKHPNAKLNDSKVAQIRKEYKDGKLQREIAKKFGVSRQTVSDIVNFKYWKKRNKEGLIKK
jgi:predicted XRE-type DNA-binding protein